MLKILQQFNKYNLPTINELLVIIFVFALGFLILRPSYQFDHRHITKQINHANHTKAFHIQATRSTVSSSPKSIEKDNSIPPIIGGLAPVISTIPTSEHVVFLGIDDGAIKQQSDLSMMQQNNIKASLFLANIFIKDNPQFFTQFQAEGSVIEDHTVNHPIPFNQLSYSQQVSEICGQADFEQQEFGKRPTLFRPPGGAYNIDTQRAAATCGMKAVVLWIAKANGGSMQYQVGNSLHPGDIVLMHFRPEFQADMQAFIDAQNAAGLHTELLENWVQ